MTLPPPTRGGFRPTQCRRPVRLAWVRDDPGASHREIGTADVRCGCWRCEGCGRRLRQLHGQLIEASYAFHFAQGHLFPRLITFTWPTDTGALVTSAADCAHTSDTFRRFVRKVRRFYKPCFDYYAVKEATRRGRLHLHVIAWGPYVVKCSRSLPGPCVLGCDPPCTGGACHRAAGCRRRGLRARQPRPCFQAIAHSVGMGWLDVKRVRGNGAGAARYIGKYLGKQHIGRPWPRYSRRVSYSRGFAPTTIRRLAAAWTERAYQAGVAAGHIIPVDFPAPEHTRWRLLSDLIRSPPAAWLGWPPGEGWAIDLAAGTVRHLGGTRSADLDTGEVIEKPWIDLTVSQWLRRMSRNTDEHAAQVAGPGWPDDPVFAEDPSLRRLIYTEARRRAYTEAGIANPLTATRRPQRPLPGPNSDPPAGR